MMIASVTLLPALLGFAGERVEVTTWRGVIGRPGPDPRDPGWPCCSASPALAWSASSLAVVVIIASFAVRQAAPKHRSRTGAPKPREQHVLVPVEPLHPAPAVAAAPDRRLAVLLVLALPLLSIRLGFGDTGNLPEKQTARQAYDLLAEGFGPGFNGPLLLVAQVPAGHGPGRPGSR